MPKKHPVTMVMFCLDWIFSVKNRFYKFNSLPTPKIKLVIHVAAFIFYAFLSAPFIYLFSC